MNSQVLFKNNIADERLSFSENLEGILSSSIQRLIKKYQESLIPPPKKEVSVIHVDEIASKVANFYEKLRKIIDWKEENLLRRSAIVRILKRSLIFEISGLNFIFKVDPEGVAEPLVLELIRGGHLPNDQVLYEKVTEVQQVLKKYIYFLKKAPYSEINSTLLLKKRINFYDWILEIAACEIEEILTPPIKENALIETMTVLMNERIRFIPNEVISEEEKVIQTYIAAHRTLFDLDDSIITYHLLKCKFKEWTNPSSVFIEETTKNIFSIWEETEKILTHPLGKEFFNICERNDTVFTLLGDVLDFHKNEPEKLSEVFLNRERLKELITQFYNKRLVTLKSRLFRIAVLSSLSVFLSNFFSYFIVEVPVAYLVYERFSLLATIVDFLIPPLAMFILVAMIKPPPATNLKKVIDLTFSFVYRREEKNIYEIKLKKKRKLISRFLIILFYILAGIAFFWFVAWLFHKAGIPVTSVFLDTLMIAVNVFAALGVRNKSKEITVEEKTSFWEFLIDVVSLPVARVGSWVARKWKEYNIVAVFFNVVVEVPFVTAIEFIEDWRNFLKEKKAEIR